ncbi:MAG: hypothetical protein JO157_17405 [Acetobacteraceae bacterium]|nr:hypothetical protein [Acetobacteraceae bacterium]
MEAMYLEPPTLGVEEEGWYVVEGDDVLAGPFGTQADADDWIEENTETEEEDDTPPPPGMRM